MAASLVESRGLCGCDERREMASPSPVHPSIVSINIGSR